MKKLNIIRKSLVILFIALALQACKNDKKDNTPKEPTATEVAVTKEGISMNSPQEKAILDTYLKLSDALISSDAKQAKVQAEALVEAYKNQENDKVLLAVTISEIEDIEEQRTLFYQLSQRMEDFITDNLKTGEIYKQYCPMAFNDTGAFWFSTSKEILNPYFGDAMLHCGNIQKTIK